MAGIAKASGAKAKADKLFSRIVRFHGACERCEYQCSWEHCRPQEGQHGRASVCKLQTAHVISRHRNNTRTDLRNAYALCAACHHFFGSFPVDFGIWVLDRMDRATYDALYQAAHKRSAVDWNEEVERLAGEWSALRAHWGLD